MADIYNNYLSTMNGIAVTRYQKGVTVMYPTDVSPLTSMLDLESGQKLGLQYQFALDLTYDDSTTYAAAGAGAFGFNDTAPGQMLPALVNSSNYHQRGVIDYETIARTADGNGPASGALEKAVDRMIFRLNTGMAANLEIDFWYGGTNIGIIGAVVVGNGSNGAPVGQARIQFTNASFAPRLFVGRKGSRYDVYQLGSTGRPTATKRNANAALVQYALDIDNRYLYVTGNSTDLAALTVGDGFLKYGSYGNGTQGMDYVMTSAGTTLYNIDTSQYDLMQANTKDNGGLAITLKRLYSHISNSISKGMGVEGVDVWCNPDTFADLLANETILRRYSEAGGTASNGFRSLTYDSQVGKMTFMPWAGIKRGEMFIGPTRSTCSKVGAQEPNLLNFDSSGFNSQFLKPQEGKAGCEAQKYGNLGFVNKMPAFWTKVSNIVNETNG